MISKEEEVEEANPPLRPMVEEIDDLFSILLRWGKIFSLLNEFDGWSMDGLLGCFVGCFGTHLRIGKYDDLVYYEIHSISKN